MFYTYVLRLNNEDLYIGSTIDLRDRLRQHQDGHVDSTKLYRPVKLIYYEACLTIEGARNRERKLKTGYGRAYLKRRLK